MTQIPNSTPEPLASNPGIHWLQPSRLAGALVLLVLSGLYVVLGYAWSLPREDCLARAIAWTLVGGAGLLTLLLLVCARLWWRIRGTLLGVFNDWLLVSLPDGTVLKARNDTLRRVRRTAIIIDRRKILLGQPHARFYQGAGCRKYLEPLLERVPQLTAGESLRWLWHNERPAVMLAVIYLLLLSLVMMWLAGGGEVVLQQWLQDYVDTCQQPGQ